MLMWQLIIVAASLFLLELFYFNIARKFNIIDKPNNRSSHNNPTIRGGGIIFFVAVLIWFDYRNFQLPWLIVGVSSAAIISFLDDLKPRQALWRFMIHFVAVLLMFYQVALFDWQWWLVLLALIFCIGALSAFNFMDGINGITGIYALVSLGSFAWINAYSINFTDETLIFVLIASVLVFLFFNFRERAVCFAGDVGSITIAYVQIFFLLQLIHKTNNFYWVLIFLVYGLDSVITIIYRLRRKENIFKAHRTHLYQYLSNEWGISHMIVSGIYGVLQLIINVVLISSLSSDSYMTIYILIPVVVLLYMVSRAITVGKITNLQNS